MIEPVTSNVQRGKKQTHRRIQNPCLIFESALEEINEQFDLLYKRYGVTFEHFQNFIQKEKPSIWQKINKYKDHIDNEIYGSFRNGRIHDQQFSQWKRSVSIWKKCFSIALRFYEMRRFGKEMVKHQLPN